MASVDGLWSRQVGQNELQLTNLQGLWLLGKFRILIDPDAHFGL